MRIESDWHSEHTTRHKIFEFLDAVVQKYENGSKQDFAVDDCLIYGSLHLEYAWDDHEPMKIAEEIQFRKQQVKRWTKAVSLALAGNLTHICLAIKEDSQFFMESDFGVSQRVGIALKNLVASVKEQ